MLRPNLARTPQLDTRPVGIAGAVLLLAGVALSAVSVAEFVNVRVEEQAAVARLTALQARERDLTAEVTALDRRLAAVGWKQLGQESKAMERIVAERQVIWSDLLRDLERVIPWDVRLINIAPSVSETGEIDLTVAGVASSRDAWLRLLSRLFADDRFAAPVPVSETAPGATNALGFRFDLRVKYRPGVQA